MPATTRSYRYQLPKKAIKADCPQCGPRHRKTLSRFVDTTTGELLPIAYGRCDRESNCGYYLSPYHKTASGMSYDDEQKQLQPSTAPLPKAWFRIAGKQKRNHVQPNGIIQCLMQMKGATLEQAERVVNYIFSKPTQATPPTPAPTIYTIPDEVVKQSLGHYEQNQFAQLLRKQFGQTQADALLQQFRIGTSARWPGACVFWLTDEQQRTRSGQVVLFADDWHKAQYTNREGNQKRCISSVSHGLLLRYRQRQQTPPDWLTDYDANAPRWPILFGLHQLATAPANKPIAVVEAPKTAVIGSAMIPAYVWMAVGALSYLNAERLAPLQGRPVVLFPDLSNNGTAFAQWSRVADELNARGYQISVSDYLESKATEQQKQAGLDLADFLLMPDRSRPHWLRNGEIIYGDVLAVEPCDHYPAEWDS